MVKGDTQLSNVKVLSSDMDTVASKQTENIADRFKNALFGSNHWLPPETEKGT